MKKLRLALGCSILVSAISIAQDEQQDATRVQQLNEVVVSDTRFPIKREQSGKTVIRIEREELERYGSRPVASLLNTRGGIEITGSRGRNGEVLGIFARGGRGRQVLVLIDGVRVSDPSSFSQEYDLRYLSAMDIESIEIIKGATSTLYGSNAATAVISITTRKASDQVLSGEFRAVAGTNQPAAHRNDGLGEFSQQARLSGMSAGWIYSGGISHSRAEDLSSLALKQGEEDVFSQIRTNLSIGKQLGERSSIRLYGNHTKLRSDYDEAFGMSDAPYQFFSEQRRAGIQAELSIFSKGTLHMNGAYTEYDSENFSAFPNSFEGNNTVIDTYYKQEIGGSVFALAGLQYSREAAELDNQPYFTIADPYLNLTYLSPVNFQMNAGLRLNNHSEYGSNLVYSINPSYTLTVNEGYLKFLGSYATAYITPSISQLYGVFGANPDLQPEINSTVEAGMEWLHSSIFRASALYFQREEENFVIFDGQNGIYRNSDAVIDARGIEVEALWQPAPEISIQSNYTFTEREGDNAIRIPAHKANLEANYFWKEGALVSLTYGYVGSRTDTDFSTFTDVDLDPYTLWGLYLSHEFLDEKLTLFAQVENLLNEEFTEILGFETRGRNFRFGLSLKL